MDTYTAALDTEELVEKALADRRKAEDEAHRKAHQDRIDNALLAIDFDDLDSASTEDLQVALDALRSEAGSDAEEYASYITDELWGRGEQDDLA